jgi:diguanylate cyclase (GGDEF)-like protein
MNMNHKKHTHTYHGIKRKNVKKELLAENSHLRSEIVEIKRQYAVLEKQAIIDPLTGIYNRRYMESLINSENIQQQGMVPVSVVMLDMDSLKKVNDTFGHAVGDMSLRILGNRLRQMIRAEDVICRYGGDEFIIFLHNVSTETAYKRAEKWRQAIEESPITCNNRQIRATISAGVATHTIHGATIAQTIEAADKALYLAKNSGRNHVAMADQPFYSFSCDLLAVNMENN